jgi:hypothetical protein
MEVVHLEKVLTPIVSTVSGMVSLVLAVWSAVENSRANAYFTLRSFERVLLRSRFVFWRETDVSESVCGIL